MAVKLKIAPRLTALNLIAMKRHISTILLVFSLLFSHCSIKKNANNNAVGGSRVQRFQYTDYGDSTFALLYGKVVEQGKTNSGKDTLLPLAGVLITVNEDSKSATTDENGEFEIGFEKGVFSLVLSTEGYETLTLTRYASDPDQVSSTDIILVKGKEKRTFEIPQWSK